MAEIFALLPVAFLLMVAIPLAVIDLRQHRLPNAFTYPAILISLLGTFAAAASSSNWEAFLVGTATNLALTGAALFASSRNGLGMGDVKLLIAMNQSLGYFSPWLVFFSLLIAAITATVIGLARVARKTLSWKDRIAFGPFLILGYVVSSGSAVIGAAVY